MEFDSYKRVQAAAKAVLERIPRFIDQHSTEQTIVESAVKLLREHGITETWYHNVPAFVLLGSRSCLSISGRDYSPSNQPVGETNLVTVDLSPSLGGVWGDCARSFFVENGECTESPTKTDFQQGYLVEEELHRQMQSFVTPDTLFSELYEFGNQKISEYGYENLDFLGNLGHSIELNPSLRRFIDKNCNEPLRSAGLFTFEPHIRKLNGVWGFKHESIYYFDASGSAVEL